jgi:hypothetical protein
MDRTVPRGRTCSGLWIEQFSEGCGVLIVIILRCQSIYRHPSLSAVNWFQKNRALSETALTELYRKVRVQKLKSATLYYTTVELGKSAIVKQR